MEAGTTAPALLVTCCQPASPSGLKNRSETSSPINTTRPRLVRRRQLPNAPVAPRRTLVGSWTASTVTFDELVDQHGLENQGQRGLLHGCQRRSAAPADHAQTLADFALDMTNVAAQWRITRRPGAAAGWAGHRPGGGEVWWVLDGFFYDVWGDAVQCRVADGIHRFRWGQIRNQTRFTSDIKDDFVLREAAINVKGRA